MRPTAYLEGWHAFHMIQIGILKLEGRIENAYWVLGYMDAEALYKRWES